jgi:hypothetical protein
MKTLRLALLGALLPILVGGLLSFPAYGASVTLGWDANPPAEQVSAYAVTDGGKEVWRGTATRVDLQLAPGAHPLSVRACAEAVNPDGSRVPICSDSTAPILVPVPGMPKGYLVSVSTTTTTTVTVGGQ